MLDRAYAQVDRKKLKQKLIARSRMTQGVEFGIAAVESCDHSDPNAFGGDA